MRRILRRIQIFLSDLSDRRLREIRKILKQRGGHKGYERLILHTYAGREDELLAYLKSKQNEGE